MKNLLAQTLDIGASQNFTRVGSPSDSIDAHFQHDEFDVLVFLQSTDMVLVFNPSERILCGKADWYVFPSPFCTIPIAMFFQSSWWVFCCANIPAVVLQLQSVKKHDEKIFYTGKKSRLGRVMFYVRS